jgi:NADPH:quinone reductase-like Zn-dependent oxidoreductase
LAALNLLRKGGVSAGQRVLVYGASGSVGTFAIQLARFFGAEVTGVCSTANLDWVKALGANRVVDYTREDFTEGGEQYDLIFDAVGKASKFKSRRVIRPGGRFVHVGMSRKDRVEDLEFLIEVVEAKKIKPVIDRCYTLEKIVDAHRYVEQGHKKGNVVIQVKPEA